MRNTVTAICQDSFKIEGRGIILELQHFANGLTSGSILHSKKRDLKWEISVRILYDHAIDHQTVFENEKHEFMRLRFSSLENKEASVIQIKEKDQRRIFTYMVSPVNHEEKPVEGEELEFIS